MVSILKIGGEYNSKQLELCGLSTDDKPIQETNGQRILNGSTFIEMDTSKVFMYSDENETWYEIG